MAYFLLLIISCSSSRQGWVGERSSAVTGVASLFRMLRFRLFSEVCEDCLWLVSEFFVVAGTAKFDFTKSDEIGAKFIIVFGGQPGYSS